MCVLLFLYSVINADYLLSSVPSAWMSSLTSHR